MKKQHLFITSWIRMKVDKVISSFGFKEFIPFNGKSFPDGPSGPIIFYLKLFTYLIAFHSNYNILRVKC